MEGEAKDKDKDKDGVVFPWRCAADGCLNFATLQCPSCAKFGLPPTRFCSQECFKRVWKDHNKIHKECAAFVPFSFEYTGELRPSYVTPMRDVPHHISKPDYYLHGEPLTERQAKAVGVTPIYTQEEINGIRTACKLGREILDLAAKFVRVGVTTEEIDRAVHQATVDRGAYPSPLNYWEFKKSCCTSVNEVICHGVPDCRPLQNGDIVNIDISAYYKGFHGDLNETFCVGEVKDEHKNLIKATYLALEEAIQSVQPNSFIKDVGEVITKSVSKSQYQVVRTYCGHGIGSLFHCSPNVPHYSKNKTKGTFKPGMVFTIEPMINMGVWKDETWPDRWTAVTKDGKRSAQFEHTLLVTETGVEVLTARTSDSVPMWWETKEDIAKLPKPYAPSYVETLLANGAVEPYPDVIVQSSSATTDTKPEQQQQQQQKKKKKNKKK